MKRLLVSSLVLLVSLAPAEMVDYVNPFIGAASDVPLGPENIHGFGKCFPGVATPGGMVQLSPDTTTTNDNGSGYSWHHPTLEGFSFLHMSGVGWYGEFGNFQVMPTVGAREFDREKACAPLDHKLEVAKAGYYSVQLPRYGVKTELTCAPRAGIIRFTYPQSDCARLQIDLGRRVGQKQRWLAHSEQFVRRVNDTTIEGYMRCPCADGGWGRGDGGVSYTVYFSCEFSRPLEKWGAAEKLAPLADNQPEYRGTNLVFFTEFATAANEQVLMRAGFSFVDVDGARRNLANDIPDFNFERVRIAARQLWQNAFNCIDVEGGSEKERIIFATALYHSLIDPRMIADVDGRYRNAVGEVCQSGKFVQRTVFSGWDVFRSEFPLLTIIRPDIVRDTICSMMEVMDCGARNTLPVWDIFGCKSSCMIGNPLIPVITDAYEKGIRGFDAEHALELSLRSNVLRGNYNGAGKLLYRDLSSALEYAYDDWCAGRLAQLLGKDDVAATMFARAQCYTNYWSSEANWMRSRNRDGSWYKWEGRTKHGQGCVESNPYQQGWFVPHDIEGLIRLMGGRDKFTDELEQFFEKTRPDFLWNDYYNHSNEPVHNVPFMFAFSSRPYLVQKWTRRICNQAYGTDVFGLVGNDDVGQMSAWYVLTSIGIHPVCPGDGRWILTSPLFTRVTLRLPNGKTFIIKSNASAENIYIRRAVLNGHELKRPYITTAELNAGGILELELSNDHP